MVRSVGIEPTQVCTHMPLKHACLPVPPRPHYGLIFTWLSAQAPREAPAGRPPAAFAASAKAILVEGLIVVLGRSPGGPKEAFVVPVKRKTAKNSVFGSPVP